MALPSVRAATSVWDNSKTNFNDKKAWVGNNLPGSGDIGSFQASTASSDPELSKNIDVLGLEFTSGTASWTFTGKSGGSTEILGIGSSGIVSNATSTQTFGADFSMLLNSAASFTSNSSGALFFNTNMVGVDNGGFLLTLNGTSTNANNNIATVISGTGGLTKSGSGSWSLSGTSANTYTGTTTVNDGTLTLAKTAGLDAVAGNLTIGDGVGAASSAIVQLTNSNQIADTANVSILADGRLNLNGQSETVGGISTASSTANIQLGSGTLTTGGNNGTNTFAGLIAGTGGSLTKTGTGTLTLSGTNTYTGVTTIAGGTLSVGTITNGGVASNLGQASNAAANLVIDGGTLRYTGAGNTSDRRFTMGTAGATIDAAGTGALNLNNTGTTALSGTNTARTLTLTGTNTGANTYAGALADNGTGATSLTKTGTGNWTLSGTNTYTGNTTVSAGTLTAGSNNALGAASSATTVSSGATLAIAGGVTIDKSSTLSIAGTGNGGAGALIAAGGAGTTSKFEGNITLTGNTTFTAGANQLVVGDGYNFDNTLSLGANTLTLNTTNASGVATTYAPAPSYAMDNTNLIINSVITGTGGLTKTGAGTATLLYFPVPPTTAYTGNTTITGGKLIVDGTESNGTTYNPVINSTNVYVGNASSPGSADSVILQMGQLASPAAANYLIGTYDSGTNTAGTSMTVYEDGLFNMNGASNRLNTLTLQGGHVSGGNASYSPLLTIVNGVTTLASSQTAVIDNGFIGMSANGFTFNVADGSAATDLRIDSVVQNGIGFTAGDAADSMVKTGTGTLKLTAANTYQGVTSIDQGVVNISNNSALGQYGPSLGSLNNGTTVASGAQLQLSNNITVNTETLSLAGTGVSNTGALLNESGNNTYKGYIYLDSDARINANSGTTLTIANPTSVNGGIMNGASAGKNLTVGGAGNTIVNGGIGSYVNNITKDGTGTLTLAGQNTYVGATNVTSGAVKVTHNNGLSGTGVTVSNGAALQFAQDANNNNINVIGVSANIQGTGIANGGAIQNLNGTNSYAGNITLANNARITANSGSSLTMTGSVSGAGYALDAGGQGNTTYSGVISGSGTAVNKTDSGTVTFSGSGANTFTGGLNVKDGTLNLNKTAGVNAVGSGTVTVGDSVGAANSATLALQANNQIVDTASVVLNSDGRLSMGTSSDAISQISGTGRIDLGTGSINMGTGSTTGGKLTIGADNSSSTFSGDITGSGTLEKLGSGTLELNSTTDISYAGSLILGGGTLKLTDIDLTVGNLLITANTTLDFSGASTLFATTFSFLNTSITLNIINWSKNTDFFYATNWTGASQDIFNNMGATPMSQVVFAGWSAHNTGWDSYDDQIYPNVPEPSTYGALLIALASALAFWKRKRVSGASTKQS